MPSEPTCSVSIAMFQIVDGAGGRGQMEDVIHFAKVEGPANILLAKLEAWLVPQMRDVLHAAGQQIVGADDRVALRQQGVAQDATPESPHRLSPAHA